MESSKDKNGEKNDKEEDRKNDENNDKKDLVQEEYKIKLHPDLKKF